MIDYDDRGLLFSFFYSEETRKRLGLDEPGIRILFICPSASKTTVHAIVAGGLEWLGRRSR